MEKVMGKDKIYRQSLDGLVFGQNGRSTWFDAVRRRSYEKFSELGFPTRKLEAWKYVDLESVLNTAFTGTAPDTRVRCSDIEKFFLPNTPQSRLVFVNGLYASEFSSLGHLPEGVILEDLAEGIRDREELLKPYLAAFGSNETNAFAAINTFSFKSGLLLYIPDKVVLEDAIHVVLVTAGDGNKPRIFYPRLLVVAGASTRLNLIVDQVQVNDPRYLSNLVSEVYLKPNACVNYFQVQRLGPSACTFAANRFYLGRYSSLNALVFTSGGSVTRNETEVHFEEEHGFCSMKGLSVLGDLSQAYHHLAAHHKAAHCTSSQFYKGILAGQAKSEFSSLVHVYPGAQKSDSRQLNKNLILSDLAQGYSRPQLKISADDVSCFHGATSGQPDKDELFYLRSRGLSEQSARYILVDGFAEEIIAEIPDKSLRDGVRQLAVRRLKEMTGV